MTSNSHIAFIALLLSVGAFYNSAAAETPEIRSYLYKGESSARPKNFYVLRQSTDTKLCSDALNALNEPFTFEPYPGNTPIRNLTGNSHSLKWSYIENTGSLPWINAYAESTGGKYYFKKFWSMGSGGSESLSIVSEKQLESLKAGNDSSLNESQVSLNSGKRTLEDGAETFTPHPIYAEFPALSSSFLDIVRFDKQDVVLVSGDVMPQFCGKTYPVIAHKILSNSEVLPTCRFESIPKIECPNP